MAKRDNSESNKESEILISHGNLRPWVRFYGEDYNTVFPF